MLKNIVCAATLLLTACGAGHGDRCNPLQYSDNGIQGDCDDGYACVYPTAANCGVAYCCKVDDKGNVNDPSPSCQPNPTLDTTCEVDLSTAPTIDMSRAD